MKIDINKKYRTVAGLWPVTIVSTNGPYPDCPIVGYIHAEGTPMLAHWSEEGGFPANTRLDLIEVRESREFKIAVLTTDGTVLHLAPHDNPADVYTNPKVEVIRVREIID